MKQILDTIAEWALSIILLIVVVFCLYLLGLTPLSIVIIIHAYPIVVLCLNTEQYISYFNIKSADKLYGASMVCAIVLFLIMLTSHDKVTTYLDKKIFDGKIVSEKSTSLDEDGNETENTHYFFEPKNKSDNNKIEVLSWWMIIITIVSPAYMYYGSKRILNKVSERHRLEKYNY